MLKIKLFSKTVKTTDNKGKEKSFRAFFTKMRIVVKGEEDKGKQEKYLTLKFRKEIDTSNFKRGYLICNEEDVNAPFKYEITTEELPNGVESKVYPCVWIRGYEKYVEEVQHHTPDEFEWEDDESEDDGYSIPDEKISDEDLPF